MLKQFKQFVAATCLCVSLFSAPAYALSLNNDLFSDPNLWGADHSLRITYASDSYVYGHQISTVVMQSPDWVLPADITHVNVLNVRTNALNFYTVYDAEMGACSTSINDGYQSLYFYYSPRGKIVCSWGPRTGGF